MKPGARCLFGLAALTAAACLHPPLTSEGARCDAEHDCGSADFACVSNVCAPAEPTLLSNGDFEQGIGAWFPLGPPASQLRWAQLGRNGSLALCADGTPGAALVPLSLDGGTFVCAEAFATVPSGTAQLQIDLRRIAADGTWQQGDGGTVALSAGSWTRAAVAAPAAAAVSLRLSASGSDELCIDDVRVWLCDGSAQ